MAALLKAIRDRLKYRRVFILQVFFREQEPPLVSCCLAGMKAGKVDILERWENLVSGERLPSKISAGVLPVYLHVAGEGVLVRELEHVHTEQSLSELLPGFQDKHYFHQLEAIGQGRQLLTLVRKDLIEEFLKDPEMEKLHVGGLFIGPSPVIRLSSYLEMDNGDVQLDGYCLSFKGKQLEHVRRNTAESSDNAIDFAGTRIRTGELVSLTCSILAFGNQQAYTYGDLVLRNGLKATFYAYWGRAVLRIGLGVLLVLLVVNFLLFDHLFKQKTSLESELASNNTLLRDLNNLNALVEQKQNFIKENKLDEFYYLSYFADQLGLPVPEDVRLDKLVFNSVEQKIKPNQAIIFRKGTLVCEGTAETVESYRQLISQLKGESWVKRFLNQNYIYKPGDAKASFKLELQCEFDISKKQ